MCVCVCGRERGGREEESWKFRGISVWYSERGRSKGYQSCGCCGTVGRAVCVCVCVCVWQRHTQKERDGRKERKNRDCIGDRAFALVNHVVHSSFVQNGPPAREREEMCVCVHMCGCVCVSVQRKRETERDTRKLSVDSSVSLARPCTSPAAPSAPQRIAQYHRQRRPLSSITSVGCDGMKRKTGTA